LNPIETSAQYFSGGGDRQNRAPLSRVTSEVGFRLPAKDFLCAPSGSKVKARSDLIKDSEETVGARLSSANRIVERRRADMAARPRIRITQWCHLIRREVVCQTNAFPDNRICAYLN